jgi:predicted ATPase
MTNPVTISRVILRNYKSIASCSVTLRPLVFLVGPNGSGKSNFLDALRFVAESLNTSLDHALRERGGINEVRRRSAGHPTHFGIRLDLTLTNDRTAYYAFQVGAKPKGGFEVQHEKCRVFSPEALGQGHFYEVESGKIKVTSLTVAPPAAGDRLYLVAAAGHPEFRPVYDLLSRMGFYNLNPEEIRDLQPSDAGDLLLRDGRNLAAVLDHLTDKDKSRVVEFLSKVVPGVTDVNVKHVGKKETLEFRQTVGSKGAPWRFMAENMSDGTLRALGILTALFQSGAPSQRKAPVVGIEEPESALHPGAAGVLRDALRAAARHTQVLVTSHSPDLLDNKSISDEDIIAVEMRRGETLIAPVDAAGRSAIRDKLYTAGELLRMNQLNPDEEQIKPMPEPDLFGNAKA